MSRHKLVVNGVPYFTRTGTISFRDLLDMTGHKGTPTVVVKPKGRDGFSVGPTDTIKTEDGMVIDVAHTGSA